MRAIPVVLCLLALCAGCGGASEECGVSSDCEPGYRCSTGGRCFRPPNYCTVTSECPVGTVCIDLACQVPSDGDAGPDGDPDADVDPVADGDTPPDGDGGADTEGPNDTVPPRVVTTIPADGETGVGVDALVEILFSEAIDTTSVTEESVAVLAAGPEAIAGGFRFGAFDHAVVFMPAEPLPFEARITVTVGVAVRDRAGNRLTAEHRFSFTTLAAPVDECQTESNPCDDDGDLLAACADQPDGYRCLCSPGFVSRDGGCHDIDECTVQSNPCNDAGNDGATCINRPGEYGCTCSGVGWLFQDGSCRDVDECRTENGGCDHACLNTDGGRECSCDPGFSLQADGRSCADIDECPTAANRCREGGDPTAACENLPGSHRCLCSDGFMPADGICRDIDECQEGVDVCVEHASCFNNVGGYSCRCEDYYSGDPRIACVFCARDDRCGAGCNPCGGGTPRCRDNGNNTSSCVGCLDNGDCTGGYLCSGNLCLPPVVFPGNACTDGNGSRDRCSNARVVSRTSAAGTWRSGSQNTCSAANRFEGDCGGLFDVGFDHAHAIFLLTGEKLKISLEAESGRCRTGDNWSSLLKIRLGSSATECPSAVHCWAGPDRGDTINNPASWIFTSPQDGWVFIIVDGGASAYNEHRGHYQLSIELYSCKDPGGECDCR